MKRGVFKVIGIAKKPNGKTRSILTDTNGHKHYFPFRLTKEEIELDYEINENGEYVFDTDGFLPPDKTYIKGHVRSISDGLKDGAVQKYFDVDYGNIIIPVPFRNWQYHSSFIPPSDVTFYLVRKGERIRINQIVDEAYEHPYYKIGESYSFKYLRTKSSSYGKGYGFLILEGEDGIVYEIPSKWKFEYDNAKKNGLYLVFAGFLKGGNLNFKHKELSFLTLEEVFLDIKTFSSLLSNLPDASVNEFFHVAKTQYSEKDNRWVLSLITSCENALNSFLERYDFKAAQALITHNIQLEEYIVKSNYLKLYSSEKAELILQSTVKYLSDLKFLNELLSHICDLTYEEFLMCEIRALSESIERDEKNLHARKIDKVLQLIPNGYLSSRQYFDIYSNLLTLSIQDIERYNYLFKYLHHKVQEAEYSLFNKNFFTNVEKKNYYYHNEDIVVLFNLYKLQYYKHFSSESELMLLIYSRMLRCIYLYISDDELSSHTIIHLLNIIELECSYGITFIDFLNYDYKIVHYAEALRISVEAQEFVTDIPQEERINFKTREKFSIISQRESRYGFGLDDASLILKSSIADHEFGYYYFHNSVRPTFEYIAYNPVTGKKLYRHVRQSLPVKTSADFKIGDVVQGEPKVILPNAAIINLDGGVGYVHKSNISHAYSLYIEDILILGKTYTFRVEDLRVENDELRLTLSRKPLLRNNYSLGEKLKAGTHKAVFLRFVSTEILTELYDLKLPNKEVDIFTYDCPACRSNNTFKVDSQNKKWYCTNEECFLVGEEAYLFFIPDLEIIVSLSTEYRNEQYLRDAKRGAFFTISIDSVTERPRKFYGNIIASTKDVSNDYIFYLEKEFDKKIYVELAKLYEDIASLAPIAEEEINWLYWSQHYYSMARHNKSFFYNVYIPYLQTMQILSLADDTENIANLVMEMKAVAKSVLTDSTIENTIKAFPLLNKHYQIFDILNNLGSIDEAWNLSKLADYYKRSIDDEIIEEIAELVLSYNLLSNNQELMTKSNYIYFTLNSIRKSLYRGRIDFVSEVDFMEQHNKTVQEFYALLNEGENQNLEFKSSLFTPVQTSDRLKKILEIEKRISQIGDSDPLREKKINGLQRRFDELKSLGTPEDVIISAMKTIAAFANSKGGTLIIGVEDNRNIVGLDSDLSKIDKDDKLDEFKLRFDEFVKQYLGDSTHTRLSTRILNVKERNVFIVKVDPISTNEDPIFLTSKIDGSKLYIRAAGSTRELDARQALEFFKGLKLSHMASPLSTA